jgi:hypothetical protein
LPSCNRKPSGAQTARPLFRTLNDSCYTDRPWPDADYAQPHRAQGKTSAGERWSDQRLASRTLAGLGQSRLISILSRMPHSPSTFCLKTQRGCHPEDGSKPEREQTARPGVMHFGDGIGWQRHSLWCSQFDRGSPPRWPRCRSRSRGHSFGSPRSRSTDICGEGCKCISACSPRRQGRAEPWGCGFSFLPQGRPRAGGRPEVANHGLDALRQGAS